MQLKKIHKSSRKILSYYKHLLKTGSYGFKIMSDVRITEKQIISIERTLKSQLKKFSIQLQKVKLWKKIHLNKTLTKLSLEARMGKGKGSVYTKVLFLEKGSIIYEFKNIKSQQIRDVFNKFKKYFPGEITLVKKN